MSVLDNTCEDYKIWGLLGMETVFLNRVMRTGLSCSSQSYFEKHKITPRFIFPSKTYISSSYLILKISKTILKCHQNLYSAATKMLDSVCLMSQWQPFSYLEK